VGWGVSCFGVYNRIGLGYQDMNGSETYIRT
jgi:hypothetical protein